MSGPLPRWTAAGHTNPGRRPTREERQNYDHFLIDAELGLIMVLDGGGNWGGIDGRARRGAEVIQQLVRSEPFTTSPQSLIERVFRTAGETLRAELDEYGDYGTTNVVMLLLCDSRVHVSWLGDCLAHRVSGDDIVPLTWPHTIHEVMRQKGTLTAEVEQQQQNPGLARVLMHFLGGELPDPLEVISFTPDPGDRVILTTDGVHDTLLPSDFLAACQTPPAPQACAERLVSLALGRGSRDNCTCAVIAFDSEGDDTAQPHAPSRRWWQFW